MTCTEAAAISLRGRAHLGIVDDDYSGQYGVDRYRLLQGVQEIRHTGGG